MTGDFINTIPSHDRMGHRIKVQVVTRAGGDQYTMTIPRPLAEFWGLKKGDELDLAEEEGTNRVILTKPARNEK